MTLQWRRQEELGPSILLTILSTRKTKAFRVQRHTVKCFI